jgi:hypothetical protein
MGLVDFSVLWKDESATRWSRGRRLEEEMEFAEMEFAGSKKGSWVYTLRVLRNP